MIYYILSQKLRFENSFFEKYALCRKKFSVYLSGFVLRYDGYRFTVIFLDSEISFFTCFYLNRSAERYAFDDRADAVGGLYVFSDTGCFPDFLFVYVVLESETAHKTTACAGDLCGVEREILLLRHLYRHLCKIGKEGRTAERASADCESSDKFGFISDSDLTEFDARAEDRSEILDQLTEVNAPFGGKVECQL